jgi:hypothetical protein
MSLTISASSSRLLDARRPAVIFANGYGDNILNLMALRALGSLFPGRLDFICGHDIQPTFFSDVPFRAVHELAFSRLATGRGSFTRTFDPEAAAAAVEGCDLLVSLNPWRSPALEALRAALAPAPSIGFSPGFDLALPMDERLHSARLAFEVPRRLCPSLRLEDFAAPLPLAGEAHGPARVLRGEVPAGARILAVHADTAADKMWPADRFLTLLDGVLADHPDLVAVIVGAEDTGLGALARRRPVISRIGLPMAATLALVGSADLFLGVDSCMLHAADIYRVPGVGLFGPTRSSEFGFLFAPHRHVDAAGPLTSLTVLQVRDALESLLAAVEDLPAPRRWMHGQG